MTFNAPANNGSAITSYSTTCSRGRHHARHDDRTGLAAHRHRADQRPHLHLHRHRNQRHRERSRLACVCIGDAERGRARPTGGTHDRGRQRPDRRHLHRTRQQRQHDHRLHRHVHRRHDSPDRASARRDSDHRHRAHQRPPRTPAPSPRPTVSVPDRPRPRRPSVLLGLPSAPAQPTIAPGNAQIVVTFAAPADNGSPITGYTATCHRRRHAGTGSITGATASPITVTGLTNGHTYTCTVTATNAIGTGPPSPARLGRSSRAARPPAAAYGRWRRRADRRHLRRTRQQRQRDHRLHRELHRRRHARHQLVRRTASPITVTGLTNGHSYTCTVTATNAIGTGRRVAGVGRGDPGPVPAGRARRRSPPATRRSS